MTRTALVSRPNFTQHDVLPTPTLENRLQAAREHARRLTALFGPTQPEVAISWESVDELLKAKARQRAAQKTPFALYCEAHPGAPECRIYDV